MRVNARFEGVAEQQIDYLVKTTEMSVSEVLRLSVDHYYRQVRGGSKPALHHLGKRIGAYRTGKADTSSNYKALIAESLAGKHSRNK